MTHTTAVKTSAKEIVLSCVKAINEQDFKIARTYVNDDMQFIGVMGARDGADAYFEDMEKMKLKYDVKKTFEDGGDVCLFYDLQISGKKIFGCGWYHLEDDKISTLKVIFDPRPLLEEKKG